MELSEFLLARISEDEEMARAASAQVEDLDAAFTEPGAEQWGWRGYSRPGASLVGSGPTREHIARWDPARVLAECEAKRRIMELHQSWPVLVEGPPEMTKADTLSGMTFRLTKRFGNEPPTTPMLRALALPYADHPDYDEAWRP